ncbi:MULTISPECIES: helix-turn-helix domain-containing protein [Providencia]|uniref:Helix-turn-helix domain-containing protein n=1 Tax=Providencia huaxiensis TaxID=2027290 RepID=A0ABU2ISG3_9GAMM|nr:MULTISPECIES: helix-turn-helix transcriptional regulator [Providencia]MBZ3680973.1 helix-turn-helix transcriptional regulator [Providencia rettgeri]AXH63187.1 helix-turn-helix transcriptional regulator [Providencia huaxiensis]MDT0132011.1 helix-turn-helix domain-containing protein [Providencia huaxiensis]MDT1978417.1 helix-turn-helix domain-containing protein [Providencia huaxiensis]QLR01550.1 helix-turn-helix transcriptional regulator [Providencia rettgeri]
MSNYYPVSAVIGNKIKSLRKNKGLSLVTLAKTVGISEQQQLRYERGNNRISVDRLKQYSNYFDINISYFFSFSEDEKIKIKNGNEIKKSFSP